jgi:SulP family sulfate permease
MDKVFSNFIALFTPKLVTCLREGYDGKRFIKDIIAGLTVAIVAMPLAMGIAIGSGATPQQGLFTAIIAGFIISAFGGSRFQIGGPTAAFVIVVYRVIDKHGMDGMLLATLAAGVILVVAGFLRLGTYIKYIPYPVTLGFTAGIGFTILAGQTADLFGLSAGKLPGEFIPKIAALIHALPTWHAPTLILSMACIAGMYLLHRFFPRLPYFLIIVAGATAAVFFLPDGILTIGDKFGSIPSMLPNPALPAFSFEKLRAVLPDAVTIALLAGIESLLSTVVADGMTGRRQHGARRPGAREYSIRLFRRVTCNGCDCPDRNQHSSRRHKSGGGHASCRVLVAVYDRRHRIDYSHPPMCFSRGAGCRGLEHDGDPCSGKFSCACDHG